MLATHSSTSLYIHLGCLDADVKLFDMLAGYVQSLVCLEFLVYYALDALVVGGLALLQTPHRRVEGLDGGLGTVLWITFQQVSE
jgi:hypothetical protein